MSKGLVADIIEVIYLVMQMNNTAGSSYRSFFLCLISVVSAVGKETSPRGYSDCEENHFNQYL